MTTSKSERERGWVQYLVYCCTACNCCCCNLWL